MRLLIEGTAGRWLCKAFVAVLVLGSACIDATAQSASQSAADTVDATAIAAAGPSSFDRADVWETLPPDFDAPLFSDSELERLIAPIALFPDVLIAQILIASTYPLDVVRADRWVRANADLEGEERFAAIEAQGWDPSIMALTGFPIVLERMAEDLDWTEALGDALITQDQDLLDAFQRLRAMAQAAGFLASGDEITVSFEDDAILIDPTDPEMIFLPLFDPDALFEAARAGAYAGTREGISAESGTSAITSGNAAPAAGSGGSATAPEAVIVEPAAPATMMVDRRGHSTAALATTGLVGFATGVAVSSLWNNNRWYRNSWRGPSRVHHHHHVHWRGGGIYRPPVLHPGTRPGHRPGLRPDDRWRPRPEDRTRRRAEIIRERETTGRPGGAGARPPGWTQPQRAPGDRGGDAVRDRLGDRGRMPQTERDRLRESVAGLPQDRVRRPDETSIRPNRPGDAARPRPQQRDSALGNQRSLTDAARDRDRGRQSVARPGSGSGASPDAARERAQQRAAQRPTAEPQRPQRPAAAPQRPQRPAAAPQRQSEPARPAQRRQSEPARGGGLDVQRTRDARQDRSRGQTSRPAGDRRPSR